MTAIPLQGDPVPVWFLLARDGGTTIRIRPGLTLCEDTDGELRVLRDGHPEGWLRFAVERAGLCVELVAKTWRFKADGRDPGHRLNVDGPMHLELPHHAFLVSDSLAPGTARTTVKLLRAVDPLVVAVAGNTESAAAAPADRPTRARSEVPIRTATSRLDAAGRRPSPGLRARRKATRPVRGHVAAGLAGLTLAVSAGFSSSAWSPTTSGELTLSATPSEADQEAGVSTGAATLPGLVEHMLAQSARPDRPTLEFAVEAYRSARRERPDDVRLSRRLNELEGQLARTTQGR